jgi:hypothetical protein
VLLIAITTVPLYAQAANPMNILQNFEGISATAPSSGVDLSLQTAGIGPIPEADTSGAVGPNHFVQTVNFGLSIFDKKGNALPLNNLVGIDAGTNHPPVSLVTSPANALIASTNAFWQGFFEDVRLGQATFTSTPCAGTWTDTSVLYDRAADRWVVIRFANNPDILTGSQTWFMCFAVSKSGDPTATWYRYAFPVSQSTFPDYPKLAIWGDGYYVTARMRVNQPADAPVLGISAPAPPAANLQAVFPPAGQPGQPGTYFVRNTCTYPGVGGTFNESVGSTETSITISAGSGQVLQVSSPTATQCPGAVSWSTYAYVPTPQSTFEQLQTQSNLPLGTNWTEPSSGLNNTSRTIGTFVMAFDRATMLAGGAAPQMVLKTVFNQFDSLGNPPSNLQGNPPAVRPGGAQMLAADWDGRTPPAAGTPEYLVRPLSSQLGWPGADSIQVYQFKVNWSIHPATGVLTLTDTLFPNAWMPACGTNQFCVPEPSPGSVLDPMSGVWGDLMNRLAYRNFGDHESLVLNHTVDSGTFDALGNETCTPNYFGPPCQVSPRWYELQRRGGPWSIFQQADYHPDSNHRWFASLAMDQLGDIAMGYSAVGTSLFPSIAFASRKATDPLNSLSAETSVKNGSGPVIGTVFWVDYTQLTLDPTDDCTFWYVNGYQPANPSGTGNPLWRTRIASFRSPGCPLAASILAYTGPVEGADKTAVTLSASLTAQGSGLPIEGAQLTFTLGTQACIGTTDFSGNASCVINLSQPSGNAVLSVSFGGNGQFSAQTTATTFIIRVPWQPGVLYKVGDRVLFGGLLYVARQTHTSQVGWEPPNVYSLWARDEADTAGIWAVQVLYSVGDRAIFQGHTYAVIQAHQSQVGWEPPNVAALWRFIN